MGPICHPYTSKLPRKSIMGSILNTVIINLLFTTLYLVQINKMSSESNIKPTFCDFVLFREHYLFLYKWGQYRPPLGLLWPYISFIGPILLYAHL